MTDNTYIIPTENGEYVYAPLSRYMCKLSEFISGNDIPPPFYNVSRKEVNSNRWGHLIIIPTQICNLSCTYCYAQKAHSSKIIDWEKLKIACDFLLSKKTNSQKTITFLGGGEPIIAWDVVKRTIEYIEKTDKDNVSFFITTNATILDTHKILFLQKHNVHIEISFDIIKHIQDTQRPFKTIKKSSYDSVIETIEQLNVRNIVFNIRATVTPLSVHLMPSMIKSLSKYSNIKVIKLEPVTGMHLNRDNFYHKFSKSFWKARKIGQRCGIEVTNSIISATRNIKTYFCEGEFCITPDGFISACHRNTSPADVNYERCLIGRISDTLELDSGKILSFIDDESVPDRCCTCFARWHCAGFCQMEWHGLSSNEITLKCEFIRENIKRKLFEEYKIGGIRKA